jgi:acetyl esterase
MRRQLLPGGRWLSAVVMVMGVSAPMLIADSDAATAIANQAVTVRSGLTYGFDGGTALKLDAYLVPGQSGKTVPAVIVLHGGGWGGGGLSDTAPEALAIARAGMDAFNVDYRLATPTSPAFPQEILDVRQAVTWVRAHAASLGVDPTRIGAFGVSAGGNLALELGTLGGGSTSGSRVSAVVAWSAPTDLTELAATAVQSCSATSCAPGSLSGLWYWALSDYLGCQLTQCAQELSAASPVDQVKASGASLMLWNSANELVPVDQETELTARAQSVGESVSENVVPGSDHGTQYSSQALGPSIAFLDAELR